MSYKEDRGEGYKVEMKMRPSPIGFDLLESLLGIHFLSPLIFHWRDFFISIYGPLTFASSILITLECISQILRNSTPSKQRGPTHVKYNKTKLKRLVRRLRAAPRLGWQVLITWNTEHILSFFSFFSNGYIENVIAWFSMLVYAKTSMVYQVSMHPSLSRKVK